MTFRFIDIPQSFQTQDLTYHPASPSIPENPTLFPERFNRIIKMILPIPLSLVSLTIRSLIFHHHLIRHHNALLARQNAFLALVIITRRQADDFRISSLMTSRMRCVGTRVCTRATGVVLLLVAPAGAECARAGTVDFVEEFGEEGTDGRDAGYYEYDPHFGSWVSFSKGSGRRGRREGRKDSWETHEAQIFRLANSNVMSEVAVSVLSSFVFTAAHAAALSDVSLYVHCLALCELVYTYTTPKPKSTISPILTWSCSFKLQNIKIGYKASAISSTAPKPRQALAPDPFT